MTGKFICVLDDTDLIPELCGYGDRNLKAIEEKLQVPVYCRGNEILLESDNKEKQELFSQVIGKMRTYAQKGISPDLDMITTIFNEAETGSAASNADYSITIAGSSRRVFPRNKNQMHLLELFNTKDLVFAIGPAGTGKTYLAVAKALSEIMQKKYRKLVITRPVVEAGESLGFLPGDLAQKISPYLRPLYDAMESLLSFEAVTKLEEAGVIEVAPLAYMRGRSLDHCYIILDEAQNTTREQMKMFLTRIGEHSRAIVTGDVTQIDLPNKSASGLVEAVKILKEIDDIGFLEFSPGDIVRNRLVKKIIDAYEKNK
ncbi:MAG: PhoH family protein [Spirochaetia bacterium]|nr:PhoH family protein [Spirochaetia bacterium]